MKKYRIYGGLFILGLIIIIIFGYIKNIEKTDGNKNDENSHIISNEVIDITNKTENIVETNIVDKNPTIITGGVELGDEEEMLEMTSYIEDKIISFKGDDGKIYKQFQNKFNYNFKNKIDIDEIKNTDVMKLGNKTINLYLQVFDVNTKKGIPETEVFFWGYYVGVTDEEGILKRNISVPKSIRILSIMSFKRGYTDGFVQFIAGDDIGGDLLFDIGVQKTDQYNLIGSTNIDIEKQNTYKFKMEGDCNFLDGKGICYEGKINLDIGYISPEYTESRILLDIPMDCITADTDSLNILESSGMAFVNVYDENGNILEKNKEREFEMCYYMSDEFWQMEKDKVEAKLARGEKLGYDDQWNYWWFDKSKNLWIADKNSIRKPGKSWICFQTNIIY